MRVGTLCYATDSGLGILAKSFYDAGVVTDAIVIRHGHHPTHDEWYPTSRFVGNLRSVKEQADIRTFCGSVDVMLFFETPFIWELVAHCRSVGVKTVIMPMHECMPERIPHQPDLWLCPSGLDVQWACRHSDEGRTGVNMMPVPVNVPWRQRTKAQVFVHNAGHGGLKGRNGTAELLAATEFIKSPVKIIIRGQGKWSGHAIRTSKGPIRNLPSTVELRDGSMSYASLWKDGGEGDVFIFPEKFNGLSLPIQEARAAGMLVMCGDRFPMNTWLLGGGHDSNNDECPVVGKGCICPNPLIPVSGYHKERIGPPYSEYDCAEFDPKDIAAKIDEWYGKDITEYSLSGKQWAQENSWTALGPKYQEVLRCLLENPS